MAKAKTGLNYYAVDTDRYQDLKIKRLKKKFGCQGIAVYDYILCEIYRDKGCYMEWNEDIVFDIAEYFALTEDIVSDIVAYCARIELFNAEKLEQGVVTSLSIQERYKDFCIHAKRKNYIIPTNVIIPENSGNIPEECVIIPENSGNIPEECVIIPENSGRLPRSKVKRSKVKRIEVNNPPPQTPPPCGEVESSSGRGGGGCVKNFYEELCKVAEVREDVYDAVAISNIFTNSLTSYYGEWLELTPEQRKGFSLFDLNDSIKKYNPAAEYGKWNALCWVKDNALNSEWEEVYRLSLSPKALFELQKLVKECKKGKIKMPGKFILSQLKQLSG